MSSHILSVTSFQCRQNPASGSEEGFYRLNAIVGPNGILPISRSTWYSWIQQGKAPPPVNLGSRIAAWRKSDIRELLQKLDPK